VILRDFVLNAEVTQKTLADALRVSRYSVNQIVNGRRAITADMAIRLGRVLSTTPEFWMNLQREVDLYSARQQLGDLVDQLKVVRSPASVP
jgi:addiction module HigA family antidote